MQKLNVFCQLKVCENIFLFSFSHTRGLLVCMPNQFTPHWTEQPVSLLASVNQQFMPGLPSLKGKSFQVKVNCFPQNKSPSLQLGAQMWPDCRSSNQKPVSDQGYTTLPGPSQLICLHLCKYPGSQMEQLNFPVSYQGCLRGHTRAGHTGWFGSTCTTSVVPGHTTITPSCAALLIRRCLGLGLGPSSNNLNPTPGTCSQPLHTWCYSFLGAELFISRKIGQKMSFPFKSNIFK